MKDNISWDVIVIQLSWAGQAAEKEAGFLEEVCDILQPLAVEYLANLQFSGNGGNRRDTYDRLRKHRR